MFLTITKKEHKDASTSGGYVIKGAMRTVLPIILVCAAGIGYGQSTNSGDIRGSVTDSSGAVIPGVKVTVLNVNTGISRDYTTDNAGLYDTSSIIAGEYTITYLKEGFEQLVRGPLSLEVGNTNINAVLKVGSITEKVIVNTNVPLLKTDSGEQSTTLEASTLEQLPQTGQDWENFIILLPGTAGNASFGNGPNPGQAASVNGNLPYSNVLADGASSNLPSSANADVSVLETVAELQVSTSAFSAQYGIGGAIYNQISKGGTDRFHGSAYEYFQNDALNAKGYGFGSQIVVPFLRYNNFGGSVGGPILKKKMFFFFDFDKTINNGSGSGFTTVPTPAMMAGDFTGQQIVYDPTTQVVTQTADGPVVTRQSFAAEYGNGNKIPANLISPVAQAIQAFFPTPATDKPNAHFVPGTLTSNGIYQNNYYYEYPSDSPFIKYFGRLDYDISPTNRLTVSDTQRDNAGSSVYIYTCPVSCQLFDIDSNNAQISDVWNISSNTINEARIGYTDQLNFYTPPSLGKGYPAKLGIPYAKADLFPSVNLYGNNCCDGPGPSTNAQYKEFSFDPSDVVTMIRGRHILHFGGEFLFQRDDTTAWGNINAATLEFYGNYTQSTVGDSSTGGVYGDFLLGDAAHWSAEVQPEYGARLKTPQMFIQDDFKIKPNLTLNLGLRYQIQHGWNEVKNNASVFDPEVLNPATGTNGALWYAATGAHGRKSLQADVFGTVLPRLGFAWSPDPSTTLRGGFGIYAYNYSLDANGNGLGNSLAAQGNLSDQTNGIYPVLQIDSSGANLPYGTPNNDPAAFAGQGITYNMFHAPVEKIYQWNVAAQRSIGSNLVGELAYVASHGFNLSFPVDINQVPESKLGPNDSPNNRPYPYWAGIGGSTGTQNAVSNYNSLQASITKRMTYGVSFNFNYTWSHFLDEQDSSGWGSRAGSQTYQRSYDPSANYGASNFDMRNAFKGRIVYQLPFGVGRTFLNHNRILDSAVGGWQVSGTMLFLSGNPYTPTINTNNSYAQAGSWYPNVVGNPKLNHPNLYTGWFNPGAFTSPANGTFGDMRRNSLYGPGINEVNLSAGKTFSLVEGIKVEIRGDATNAFNHPSFGLPNSGLDCTTPGVPCSSSANITGLTVGGRSMQLAARLSF
jgi:Carboxypeptidase regulatory-like domain